MKTLPQPKATRRALTRELAQYAARSRAADLPEQVRAEAVRTLVNFVGCALGGCREPSSTVAAAHVGKTSGPAQASVLGSAQRTDVANAALLNCIAASCQAFDDAHLPTVTHPSSPGGAAMLAVSEWRGIPGPEFLNALALTIELECRLSNALVLSSKFNPAFYITGLVGPIGVALGTGNLLGLDEQRMIPAIGLAAAQGGGFRAINGTMNGHFRPGTAARAGVTAALLAAEGYEGIEDVLEVKQGFFDVYGADADLDVVVDGLGREFEIFKNAYKPYPCGIVIHPSLDACLDVYGQAGSGARPVDVQLWVHPFTLTLCGRRTPATVLESHVSLYHWAAAALLRGRAGIAESQFDCIDDPEVVALRNRIQAAVDPTLGREQAIAEVTYADGRKLRARVEHVRGSLERPMTDGELDVKFRAQAATVLPEAKVEELLRLCRGAAELPDVGKAISAAARP